MSRKPHVEKHFKASDTVRDIVIGMSDGLTVPFALAAGLIAGLAYDTPEEEEDEVARIFMQTRLILDRAVGRTPRSARDPLVPLPLPESYAGRPQAGQGAGRGPGGPPHSDWRMGH